MEDSNDQHALMGQSVEDTVTFVGEHADAGPKLRPRRPGFGIGPQQREYACQSAGIAIGSVVAEAPRAVSVDLHKVGLRATAEPNLTHRDAVR